MKKIVILFSAILMGLSIQAQETELNKNARVSFEVDGVCGMCKKRIEKAALNSKGVKYALWNVKTHQLNLIVDERKTTISEVQKNIANVGHDIILKDKKIVAPTKAYNSVNPCCKYRDKKVVEDHKGMKGMKH